jgi:hypothetical protein
LIQQVALDAGANYAVVEMPPGPPVAPASSATC